MSSNYNFKQHLGQAINIDQSFGSQCFDWSVFCARIISGDSSFYPTCSITGGVKDWADNQDSKNQWLNAGWKWEYNNPNDLSQIAPDNSIFVYNKGEWGHTALTLSATSNRLTIIEQNAGDTNDGDGKGGDEVSLRIIDYSTITGWFYYPDQYNNQQSQTQTTQNAMPNFHIQSETELNKWVELYAESRLRELGVPVIKQIELHTKLVALNSKFNQNWILARFQLGTQDELVNMINEVYGWSVKEAEIKQSTNLQQITETDVKVSKYYRDLLDELNTVKAELNTYKISSPVVKTDKVIRYDTEVVQVKQEDKIKQLSTFTVFCKNNLTSFGTLITAVGLGYKQIIEYIKNQPYILYGLLAVIIITCIGAVALERIYKNKK